MQIYCLERTLKSVKPADLAKVRHKRLWIDVSGITKEESELLRKVFRLHPLTIDDLQSSQTRIKVEEFQEYLFCVFYGVKKDEELALVELDFILGNTFLITAHAKPIPSFEEIKSDGVHLTDFLAKGPDFLFYKLLDMEVDNFYPTLEFIDDYIEKLEESVTQKPKAQVLQDIMAVKRMLILLKKTSLPQREKISFLAKNEYSFISRQAMPYFRDVYDHSIRVSDSIENYREAVSNTLEIYLSTLNNNMGEVMKFLSVVATIALPLTVISSIYGTNFTNLPGADAPNGFYDMIGIMIIISAGMMVYFRMKRWI